MLGVAAACLWTAQGAFITACSNDENRGRNSGIFWAMLQSSLLTGNLIGFFQFPDPDRITPAQAHLFYWILFGVAAGGVVVLCLLRKPVQDLSASSYSSVNDSTASSASMAGKMGPIEAAKATFKLLVTPKMLQLSVIIMYSGLVLTFWSTKYPTMIGGNLSPGPKLPRAFKPSMIGLSGICVGAGEVIGGLSMGKLGDRAGRSTVIIIGLALHTIALFLVEFNFLGGYMEPKCVSSPRPASHPPVACSCSPGPALPSVRGEPPRSL